MPIPPLECSPWLRVRRAIASGHSPIYIHLKLNMKSKIQTINTKQLRTQMRAVIERVRKGGSFLVLHRSKPAFKINPPEFEDIPICPLNEDPIYPATAVGRSQDGLHASDHDEILYSK